LPMEVLQGFSATFEIIMEERLFDLMAGTGTFYDKFLEVKAKGVRELVFEEWRRE
jgi:hypothetical protein